MRWSGSVELPDIVRLIAHRKPQELSTASLVNMVENGEAPRIARMMVDAGTLFPAFFELLVHEKWPVRLGAMVAMESLAAEDRDLAAAAVDPLWDLFGGAIRYGSGRYPLSFRRKRLPQRGGKIAVGTRGRLLRTQG